MIFVFCVDIPALVDAGTLPASFSNACIVARDKRLCIIDESCLPTLPARGPGTELKSLLAGWPFFIVSTPDCKCNARARYMDAKGCDWCESDEGMTEIMAFLRESAAERGLPFVDIAARLLVKRAIHNARKAEARRASEEASQAAAEGPAA